MRASKWCEREQNSWTRFFGVNLIVVHKLNELLFSVIPFEKGILEFNWIESNSNIYSLLPLRYTDVTIRALLYCYYCYCYCIKGSLEFSDFCNISIFNTSIESQRCIAFDDLLRPYWKLISYMYVFSPYRWQCQWLAIWPFGSQKNLWATKMAIATL